MDLSAATKETFLPHQGAAFRLLHQGGPGVDLVLLEVRGGRVRASRPGIRTEPFRLLFRGPHSPAVAQGIYAFDHPALPGLELFIVPLDEDAEGRHYEALFN